MIGIFRFIFSQGFVWRCLKFDFAYIHTYLADHRVEKSPSGLTRGLKKTMGQDLRNEPAIEGGAGALCIVDPSRPHFRFLRAPLKITSFAHHLSSEQVKPPYPDTQLYLEPPVLLYIPIKPSEGLFQGHEERLDVVARPRDVRRILLVRATPSRRGG